MFDHVYIPSIIGLAALFVGWGLSGFVLQVGVGARSPLHRLACCALAVLLGLLGVLIALSIANSSDGLVKVLQAAAVGAWTWEVVRYLWRF